MRPEGDELQFDGDLFLLVAGDADSTTSLLLGDVESEVVHFAKQEFITGE